MFLAQLDYPKTNTGTIICHSSDKNVFEYIKKTAPYLREAKERHTTIDTPQISNNYWNKILLEAQKYDLDPVIYLRGEEPSLSLPERAKEYFLLIDSCHKDLLKKSIFEFLHRLGKNTNISLDGINAKFKNILGINPDQDKNI